MAFPSTFSSFSRPAATDKLNNPSHSALHNSVSSAVGQLEAVIGLNGNSSTAGTLTYMIESPDSNGGGHVQTANKGGTGQTAFTKGDLLVAQSSSVLVKLAVGAEGQVLTASTAAAAGVGWTNAGGTRLAVSGSVVSIINPGSVIETSLISGIQIPASVISTNGAIRSTVFIKDMELPFAGGVAINVVYGSSSVFQIGLSTNRFTSSVVGKIETEIISKGSSSSQLGIANVTLYQQQTTLTTASFFSLNQGVFNTSVDAGASQNLGVTVVFNNNTSGNRIDTGGYIIERIL